MTLRKNRRVNWKLYCIEDSSFLRGRDAVRTADRLLRQGADAVQLRFKNVPSSVLVPLAKKIRRIALKRQKTVLINDRPDVCLAAAVDGVHVGGGDIPVRRVRQLAGKKCLVGRTVHAMKDLAFSRHSRPDYLGVGPVFATPLKRRVGAKGLKFIKRVKRKSRLPLFAIGGINEQNAGRVLEAGADGLCVVRAAAGGSRFLTECRKKINDNYSGHDHIRKIKA